MALDRRDRAGARTPADLAKKYGLGNSEKELEKLIKEVQPLPTTVEPYTSSMYRKINDDYGDEIEWLNPPMSYIDQPYRTMERFLSAAVYTAIVTDEASFDPFGGTKYKHVVIRRAVSDETYMGAFTQLWFIRELRNQEN
jgi:hypothetical protein